MDLCKNVSEAILKTATPEMHLHTLRSLLNYHERMMGTRNCPDKSCETADQFDGRCPKTLFLDLYAEALREAIRCIEIVHKDELGRIGR